MHKLQNKISSITKRAMITSPGDDDKDIAYCQVTYLGKVTNIETIYPYGMSAKAPANNIVMLSNVGSNEANLVGTPYSQQGRFKSLQVGEVVVGNPVTGSYVKFLANGDIQIESKGKLIVNAAKDMTVNVVNELDITAKDIKINSETFALTSQTMQFTSGSFSFGFDTSGVFQGNGKFNFGTGGLAIARVGDQVIVGGVTGAITTGSTNNTSA